MASQSMLPYLALNSLNSLPSANPHDDLANVVKDRGSGHHIVELGLRVPRLDRTARCIRRVRTGEGVRDRALDLRRDSSSSARWWTLGCVREVQVATASSSAETSWCSRLHQWRTAKERSCPALGDDGYSSLIAGTPWLRAENRRRLRNARWRLIVAWL